MPDTNRLTQLHETISRVVVPAGFEYADSLIHLYIGGSEAHGAKLEDKSDLDLYGVYIPAPGKALGITEYVNGEDDPQRVAVNPDHFVWSTSGKNKKNGPDDIDFSAFSLRKWAGQAAKGNATALHYLFMPNLSMRPSMWEKHIRPNAHMFVSSRAGFHFKEFAKDQLKRLMGDLGKGKHGQRPELIEKYGYDTKAAMHVLRIIGEGIELMKHGKITLPRPDKDFLIGIRKGEAGNLKSFQKLAEDLFAKLEAARLASELPELVDRAAISKLISDTYLDFWTEGYWLDPKQITGGRWRVKK
jgi:predicted nucleotidyltransferase